MKAEHDRVSDRMRRPLAPVLHARESPAAEKNHDAGSEQPRARSKRTGGEEVDEQQPHTDELRAASRVVEGLRHVSLGGSGCGLLAVRLETSDARLYIRSKFFSISRRVRRSITGRPCGQI